MSLLQPPRQQFFVDKTYGHFYGTVYYCDPSKGRGRIILQYFSTFFSSSKQLQKYPDKIDNRNQSLFLNCLNNCELYNVYVHILIQNVLCK